MTLFPLRDDTCQLALKMRECEGQVSYDSSRYERNASWYGNVLWSSIEMFGCVPLLDGTDDYAEVEDGNDIMEAVDNSQAISIVFWIRYHTDSQGGYIFSYGKEGPDNTVTVRSTDSGQVAFEAKKDGSPLWALSSYNTVDDEDFYFIAAIADASEALLYLNSNKEDSESLSEFWEKNSDRSLYIGARDVVGSGLQDYWCGYLCELRVYNRRLTEDEIKALELYYRNFEVRPAILCPRPTL